VLHESGDIHSDVKFRNPPAGPELTAITCDPKIPIKLKGLILYKSMIRSVLPYGSEAWPTLAKHVHKVHAVEIKMLRWMCGVT